MKEAILVEGEASQINTLRWEDYTQTAVAGRIGISVPTLHYWETGTQYPSKLDYWHDWARAVGMRFEANVK